MSSARRGAAVLGSPIAHSLSPVLHLAAYEALGLSDWGYRAVECAETGLPQVLGALAEEGLAGVSLTMPLKRAVLPLLARVEGVAAAVGAANTVLFAADGWRGLNTDVDGLVAAVRPALADSAGLEDGEAVVLGGGATAASALAALCELGDTAPTVYVRRPAAVDELQSAAGRLGVEPVMRGWPDASGGVAGARLVLSTVPAGAADALADGLPGRVSGVLFDVVYARWPTRLATAWADRGGAVVGGLELLVEQAALQVRLMTGLEAPVEVMRAAGRRALSG
jgi:shikimate dehydrogenase